MSDYISAADTNKLIRKALAKAWPKVSFRVYLGSGGNSANIEWVDGPTEEEVKQITNNYEGESFDGMQDLASPKYGVHPETKKVVHFGTRYVFEHRGYSEAFLRPIAEKVAKEWGYPTPALVINADKKTAYVSQDYSIHPGKGPYTLSDLIHQEARKTSAVGPTAPAPTPSTSGYYAKKVDGGWEVHNCQYEDRKTFQQYRDTLGFRWNKDNPNKKEHFWWCPVEKLPDDVQALIDKSAFQEVVEALPDEIVSPATKFRAMATNLQKSIDEKRNPATAHQNPTARRASIIESMAQDADNLERLQNTFIKLAEKWEDETLPDCLKGVTMRAQVERLMKYDWVPKAVEDETAFHQMVKAGLASQTKYSEARYAMIDILKSLEPAKPTLEQQIAAKKRELIGTRIDGFFPTPHETVMRMVVKADIRAGMSVLEPSAGWGNIADGIKAEHPDINVHCVECVGRLSDLLKLKGHTVVAYNIFDYLVSDAAMYDRVLMNPPFENEQDIEHVQYVYKNLLKDGGRMVAIMSEHAFFAKTKKARDFRDWLDMVGDSESLPAGTFEKNEYRATGVATRIVVIDKPLTMPEPKPIDPLVKAQRDYSAAVMGDDLEAMKTAARALREALANKEKEHATT